MLEFLDKPGFLIVALAGILIFGAKRLPESARSLGRSMRILKAETKGLHADGVPVEGSPHAQVARGTIDLSDATGATASAGVASPAPTVSSIAVSADVTRPV